jgi:hypothetical protein
MSKSLGVMDTVRTILLILVVFFVSLYLGIFSVFLVPVFFAAFWYYFIKSKRLQRQLDEKDKTKSGSPSTSPESGNVPQPPSTDA